ncbi:binding-protein-dependent transport systems inner membrane component [Isosphaera pallida ATCC 43644]|uniref:Binding-protein-dependent transport systems inner membrane component n=1 Tax=Isosphaera pallida (strain ATCC 43644 / DSM 9630 / IS1B) TaxID=575540 RepID=E8QXE4_ISOPI|nr:ABC transporter permease [Isosphaera pallida]ADV61985.1 binding-protein-dependent transport systems inner membrane component [Isosphaera pallida ATCC 43644]
MPDAETTAIVIRTLAIVLAGVGIASLLGVPLGAWLGLARARGTTALRTLVLASMGFPPVVVGFVIHRLIRQRGPLGMLGWEHTPTAVVLAQVVLALPWVVGLTMLAIASVPRERVIQVRALGATLGQTRRLLLHERRHWVAIAVLAAMARGFSEVGATLIVGGDLPDRTRVLTTVLVANPDEGGVFLVVWLLVLVVSLNILMARLAETDRSF